MKDKKKFRIFIFSIIIFMCIMITKKVFQNDTFYTIKLGELVLNNGIDMLDHYSFHTLMYTYPHWLYDVFIFLIYKAFSYTGVYISTIILFIILMGLIYYTNTKMFKKEVIVGFITIVSILAMSNFVTARAQLVSYILFVLEFYFIEMFLKTGSKKYGIFLLLISLILCNIHVAVWPFYFILFLPFIAEYIIAKLFKKKSILFGRIDIEKNNNVKYLLLIMLLSTLTGLLTPIGDTPYTYLYNTMKGETTKEIFEHLPIVLYECKTVLVYIIIVNCLITFTKVKIKLSNLLLVVGLILLTLMHNRQQSMLYFVGILVVNKIICKLFNEEEMKDVLKLFTSKLVCTILVLMFIIIMIIGLRINKDNQFISKTFYPVEAVEYIKNNLDIQNIKLFNEYNFGSYLLFEGIPVFIDSRADVYDSAFNGWKNDIFMDYINISEKGENYRYKFEKYGITHILIYRNTILSRILNVDDDYKQLYIDSNFILYERLNVN